MVAFRDLYRNICALLNQKLGTCPKCMASSIVGSGLSWLAVAIVYGMWPDRLARAFTLIVAIAFTALMVTHVVVHMFRAAPVVRVQTASRGGRQKSRREFALAVASSGFSFAAAALVSLPLLPRRADAKSHSSTYALYCVGTGCAAQGKGGSSAIQCINLGLNPSAAYAIACSGGALPPATLTCTNKGCSGTNSATLELISTSCGPIPPGASTLPRGFKCS